MKAIGWFSGFRLLGVFGGRGDRRLVRDYFLVSLFLVGGGLVTGGLLEIYFRYFESREQISQLRGEVAAGTAFKVEQFVQEIEKTMLWATKSREIILEGVSPKYKFELRKLLLIAPPVTEAVAMDETGVARTQVSRLRTISLKDRRDLSATPAFRKATQGKSYFGPVYYVQDSEPYMTIAVPIERFAGEVIGVLQAEVNLKYIWDMISAIQVGKAGYAYVVAHYGDLIAHPNLSLVLQRRNLAHLDQVKAAFSRSDPIPDAPRGIIAENLQGDKIFSSHALIPTLDWAIIIEQPVEEAYEKLYASLFRTSGLLLMGLGIAFGNPST
jgi:hypothetical protein